MKTVEDSYRLMAATLLEAVSGKDWEFLQIEAPILGRDLGGTTVQKKMFDGEWVDIPIGLRIFEIQRAAIFLRDDLLKTTKQRIWGVTFILFPTGKFRVEYDYEKPVGYEETDEVINASEAFKGLKG